MDALDAVRLSPIMSRTQGRPEIAVALIDGPVARDHPDLSRSTIKAISSDSGGSCLQSSSLSCSHGTFVAGILVARRGSPAPAICPRCTLLLRPIFTENSNRLDRMPTASPQQLATAMSDVIRAGANIVNLSASLFQSSLRSERHLKEVLDDAALRGVLVVAAAGNQSIIGSSVITHHPWVIPVVSSDFQGKPTAESNLGRSIGCRGLSAPGENITSLGTDGRTGTFGGTSAAAPFVTGAIALLMSEFPYAGAARIKLSLTQTSIRPRTMVTPPMLDAWSAYEFLSRN
jgi:subtilisin family serine protease